MTKQDEALPQRLLVFGASGHIAGPLARYVAGRSPQTALRLVTSSAGKLAQLKADHPGAECVVASYLEPGTLDTALEGVDAVFVVTPDFLDEKLAMGNLVEAVRKAGSVRRIVRLTGDPIGIHSQEQVPRYLREWNGGTAVQHLVAREILEASGLPVVFMNIASYFMDNFLTQFALPLKAARTLALPYDHRMSFVDAGDVGEACAAVLISPDHRHTGKTYNLDNGHDVLLFSDVAALLSEVLGEEVRYDGTPEKFLELNAAAVNAWVGRPDGADYYVRYFEWERELSTLWRKTDILPYLLDRPGKTLRTWFTEHEQELKSLLKG